MISRANSDPESGTGSIELGRRKNLVRRGEIGRQFGFDESFSSLPPKRPHLEVDQKCSPCWIVFCYLVTFWAPPPFLKLFGLETKDRRTAWREKMGLIAIILSFGVIIAFLTFGFTRSVCVGVTKRFKETEITKESVVINGRAYDLSDFSHPAAAGIDDGTNVLNSPVDAGGKDLTFLFQNVNGNCKGLIKPRDNCTIPNEDDNLAWYMPCQMRPLDGNTTPNFTFNHYDGYSCHTSAKARELFYDMEVQGDVYYTWEEIQNSTRDLVVYNGYVLDMDLVSWFQKDDITYPELFDKLMNDKTMRGYDISLLLTEPHERQAANCLIETVKIGVVDASTIGCIAAKLVLYVSLAFVLSIVLSKFFVACYFKWVVSPRQGAFKKSYQTLDQVDPETLNYSPKYVTMTTETFMREKALAETALKKRKFNTSFIASSSTTTIANNGFGVDLNNVQVIETLGSDLVSANAVEQPPVNWEPFGYPLVHTMCLVTCYSEDEAGIRTTMDSIATTDYPNSHKLIVVICDGLITGAGNEQSTPDICLGLMQDFVTPPNEVEPYSYVSVAQGAKRHNMARVYAGFYKYDDNTVTPSEQKKTPVLLIVKCGTEAEANAAKPGNRGKRDSQIILMSFLQAITYNERMSELQFEMMRAVWQVTGILATFYELLLMVDADTLVSSDCLTHMDAEMVKHPEIMGLCGETQIANKLESWVTAIQVYEYYISHHQAKAFESVFRSVTCLPGCFCMYRIKSPKEYNCWVPILANSEIVNKYSDNVLNSLHKKNLMLLGEDRYLTSLMLKAFPRREQVFVPKAVCKTFVPNKFKVLLSQRRRWINSTVHNLMELVLVNDLCGAFCFSMQFIIGIELIGTLVLPASITFTLYVIIVAIVQTPTPWITLILMSIIFGLPALLIIVTVSSFTYIIWMLVYLCSLPVWNFVLPVYAFWKFDDFSWGDTRKTSDGDKGSHSDADGEFDGSKIIHMTWREYEAKRLHS
ncbi:unnamed protein product [Ambrosiozyma monospora]|uniref:chitin synthase n=1 Tax=Ambrosiozyma monospora TaxID=43982 RepID=A0A9W6YSY1_AMBMO|nr:unnamed protein product [Ambrosiozyma monospora]